MPSAIITEGSGHSGTVYTGVTDTHMQQINPTANYHTNTSASTTSWDVGDDTRAIVKFGGLSNITGPVVVSSASIFLRFSPATASQVFAIHRIKLAVDTSQASWNNRLTATPWPVGGAFDSASIDTTPAASVTGIATNTWAEFTGAGVVSMVEGWINGTLPNEGFLIKRNPESHDAVPTAFSSSENGTTAFRPYLVVTFEAGGATPNWTISSPTVNSNAGTVTLVVTLDAPAPGGGFSGLVNTVNGTATAGVHFTGQTDVPFSIAAGLTTGNIVVPIGSPVDTNTFIDDDYIGDYYV